MRAGLNQTGSNQLNIGNLIFGTSVGTAAATGTGNVGIATSSPNGKLGVAGNIFSSGFHDTSGTAPRAAAPSISRQTSVASGKSKASMSTFSPRSIVQL